MELPLDSPNTIMPSYHKPTKHLIWINSGISLQKQQSFYYKQMFLHHRVPQACFFSRRASSSTAVLLVAGALLISSDVWRETRQNSVLITKSHIQRYLNAELNYPLQPDHCHPARPDGKVIAWPVQRKRDTEAIMIIFWMQLLVFHVSVSEMESRGMWRYWGNQMKEFAGTGWEFKRMYFSSPHKTWTVFISNSIYLSSFIY